MLGSDTYTRSRSLCSTDQRETDSTVSFCSEAKPLRPSRGSPGRYHLQTYHFLTRLLPVPHVLYHADHYLRN